MAWTSAGSAAESRSLVKLAESLVSDTRRVFSRKCGIVASETTADEPSGSLGLAGTLAVNIADSKVWMLNGSDIWVELTATT